MHTMEKYHDLNTRIINLTVQIQEHYPELYRNLNEMHATLPIANTPVINKTALGNWYESLMLLMMHYESAHRQ